MFAERGFAASSVRDITTAAECNLAGVNYYFGNKRNLYHEVFRRRLAQLREQRLAALEDAYGEGAGAPDLNAILRGFAEAFLAPLREEQAGRVPMRLMLREIVDPLLPRGFFHAELLLPVNQALTRAVTRAAPRLGERTIALCAQSFIAQLLHVINVQRLAAGSAEGQSHPFTVSESIEHIVRFTIAGILGLKEVDQ